MARKGKSKTKKRTPSAWILFVKKISKENPGMMFKDVLVKASALKKKGAMTKKR
jgi:hypothetical protein